MKIITVWKENVIFFDVTNFDGIVFIKLGLKVPQVNIILDIYIYPSTKFSPLSFKGP